MQRFNNDELERQISDQQAKEPSINTGRAGKGLGTSRPRPGVRKVTLYFSDAEWTAVRRAAFELDSTFTNVVRKAVKDQLGVECARILVDEERARCVTAIDKFLDKLNDFEDELEEMRRTMTSKPGGE